MTRCAYLMAISICCAPLASRSEDRVTNLPSDTPPTFSVPTAQFDHVKREEMIAMRDGVRLKTIVVIPKGARDAPMLLTRTPYNASNRVRRFNSPRMLAALPQMLDTAVAAGYIVVY